MAIIRKARHLDAKPLAEIAENTFRATFAAANTSEDMDLHCRASYSEAIQASEISNPSMVTLVSEDGGRLVAFAQLRWGASPRCVVSEAAGEIQRLYVESSWHGKGLAQDLMKACLAEMKQRRSDMVWLGVWERNTRAISFYRRLGFEQVGEHVFLVGTDPQRDIVMARSLEDTFSAT